MKPQHRAVGSLRAPIGGLVHFPPVYMRGFDVKMSNVREDINRRR